MSYGLVICGECRREVHQRDRLWYHCEDQTGKCRGAGANYANTVEEIVGPYCGADDMDGKFPKQSSHKDREVQLRRERNRGWTPIVATSLIALSGSPLLRALKPKKATLGVIIGDMIRLCPSGHHAWYESNVGPVRKPLGAR